MSARNSHRPRPVVASRRWGLGLLASAGPVALSPTVLVSDGYQLTLRTGDGKESVFRFQLIGSPSEVPSEAPAALTVLKAVEHRTLIVVRLDPQAEDKVDHQVAYCALLHSGLGMACHSHHDAPP
ncbi:exported hypothetical protein [Thiocapsa sp. KS1]|nr:hypothetical protein [Thiocapsa sp. KS1]CRI64675.1 exported hypothetical protein [Thiocapsa sp. KS1]